MGSFGAYMSNMQLAHADETAKLRKRLREAEKVIEACWDHIEHDDRCRGPGACNCGASEVLTAIQKWREAGD